MAEIKSAIELAMEKTRGLVIDSKEREAMANKEIEDKVRAVIRRYLEAMIDEEDAARELTRIPGDEALKKTLLVDILVGECDLLMDHDRLVALIRTAGIDFPQSVGDEFVTLNSLFRKELQGREKEIRERIRDKLAGLGITGSGVEPNLEAWDEWRQEVERVGGVFRKKMEGLKDRIPATGRNT